METGRSTEPRCDIVGRLAVPREDRTDAEKDDVIRVEAAAAGKSSA
jgi:hypothetical protein